MRVVPGSGGCSRHRRVRCSCAPSTDRARTSCEYFWAILHLPSVALGMPSRDLPGRCPRRAGIESHGSRRSARGSPRGEPLQDISRQVVIALRWLPLILIGALAAGAIAYSVTSGQPKVYEATATLVVDPGPEPERAGPGRGRGGRGPVRGPSPLAWRRRRGHRDARTGRESRRVLQDRISTSTDDETLELAISARDEDPEAARLLAMTLGDEMRAARPGAAHHRRGEGGRRRHRGEQAVDQEAAEPPRRAASEEQQDAAGPE